MHALRVPSTLRLPRPFLGLGEHRRLVCLGVGAIGSLVWWWRGLTVSGVCWQTECGRQVVVVVVVMVVMVVVVVVWEGGGLGRIPGNRRAAGLGVYGRLLER